ncbi:MAG: GHKL domain-containing protein [Deltaproteobacteria bacterium]|nr:GHKL domain-containing protein [Deltaproteobacteria bacterium]
MIRLIVAFSGAVGLILLMAFMASRLVRSRTEGLSVRLQVFVALALIVGAFAFGLGLLVLDRIESRATLLASEAARDEAATLAASIGGQIDTSGATLEGIARALTLERQRGGPARLSLSLLDDKGRELFHDGPRKDDPGTVSVSAPIETRVGVIGHVQVIKPTIIMRRLLGDFAPVVLLISAILGVAAAIAAALIGRAIAAPIESLTAFAVRVSEGERKAQPPVAHGLEVKRLSKAIDKMRRELEGRPYVESFAADLSHELKNPVAAIRAAAEVLDEGALAEPEEAARFVKRIREATGRIEALLAELLSLARIESRGIETEDEVDVAALARRCSEAIASRATLELSLDEDPPPVRGDPRWITRAIDNMIDNAIVHGDGSAQPKLRVRHDDQNVIVSVVNSGKIAPHIRKRLFRRFVTTRGEKGGTGLGLAIVRAVAEAHRGKVEVEEREQEVEFRMLLPRA